MFRVMSQPHLVFISSVLLLMLYGFLKQNQMLTLVIDDTYIVFSALNLATFLSIVFTIIGIGYWILIRNYRKIFKKLIGVHIILTFVPILLIFILSQFYRESYSEYIFNEKIRFSIYLLSAIAIVSQLLYPIIILNAMMVNNNRIK